MSLNVNLVALSDSQLKELAINAVVNYESLRFTQSYEKVSVQDLRVLEEATSKYNLMNDSEGKQINQTLQAIISRDESAVEKMERQRAGKANIIHQTRNLMNRQMYCNRY